MPYERWKIFEVCGDGSGQQMRVLHYKLAHTIISRVKHYSLNYCQVNYALMVHRLIIVLQEVSDGEMLEFTLDSSSPIFSARNKTNLLQRDRSLVISY